MEHIRQDVCLADSTNLAGLSLECDIGEQKCKSDGPYLLPQLRQAASIDRMATSFYLGPDDADVPNAQMILGGAYDKAKIDGELFTVHTVDPFDAKLGLGQTKNANATALEVVVGGNSTSQSYGEPGFGSPVLLDTGIATWYLPDAIFKPAFHALGGTGDGTLSQPWQPVDCKYRDPANVQGHISVEFGTGGKIEIPLHTLVTKFADGTCGAFILGRGSELSAFGDPFLRGVYIIRPGEDDDIHGSGQAHRRRGGSRIPGGWLQGERLDLAPKYFSVALSLKDFTTRVRRH